MEYELEIITESKNSLFLFKKTRFATFDEIVDYVNELATIYKKSAKLIVVVFDEDKKSVAQFHYDYGWLVF